MIGVLKSPKQNKTKNLPVAVICELAYCGFNNRKAQLVESNFKSYFSP